MYRIWWSAPQAPPAVQSASRRKQCLAKEQKAPRLRLGGPRFGWFDFPRKATGVVLGIRASLPSTDSCRENQFPRGKQHEGLRAEGGATAEVPIQQMKRTASTLPSFLVISFARNNRRLRKTRAEIKENRTEKAGTIRRKRFGSER